MRTTLTLDDDVVASLDQLRKIHDTSFKDIVNDALRQGVRVMRKPPERKRVTLRVFDAGEPLIKNLDNIGEVLAILEGEDYK